MVAILSKPSKMPGTSFSIPAQRCVTGSVLAKIPGSVCYDCYALKGAYIWPIVQNAMEYRLDLLNSSDFVSVMVTELTRDGQQSIAGGIRATFTASRIASKLLPCAD